MTNMLRGSILASGGVPRLSPITKLEVVIIKPNGYGPDPKGKGHVLRYRFGTMPNGTLPHLASLIPKEMHGVPIAINALIDEYVEIDSELSYLKHLQKPMDRSHRKLVLVCGIQSWQFQRAMDLAAFAHNEGCLVVVGGPHLLTCHVDELYGRGISFGLAEAELILGTILDDAIRDGKLRDFYGEGQRWAQDMGSSLIEPPSHQNQKRYGIKMIGFNIAAGCPFTCSFCTVFEAFGNQIRARPFDSIIENLLNFKKKGVQIVMFTSDNFNKIPSIKELLRMMIEAKINIPFFAQCDTQLERDEELIQLMMQAGCTQIFIGLESLAEENLEEVHKIHNLGDSKRDVYQRTENLIKLLRQYKINSQIATIIGFRHDTEQTIIRQLDYMKLLDPDIGSFYILTPIPGTKDFVTFTKDGLIRERNMDLYDCTQNVWNHPNISPQRLKELLYTCYREFYTLSHFRQHAKRIWERNKPGMWQDIAISAGYNIFSRYAAWRQMHPLGGGVGRVVIDSASDYADLRKKYFGQVLDENDLFPLPRKREISTQEKQLNQELKDQNQKRRLVVIQ